MTDRTVLDRLTARELTELEIVQARKTLARSAVAAGGSVAELLEALLACGIAPEPLKPSRPYPSNPTTTKTSQGRSEARETELALCRNQLHAVARGARCEKCRLEARRRYRDARRVRAGGTST